MAAERPRSRRASIAVAVTDAVPVFEFAVPCEVFGIDRSDIVSPWYDFRLCAAEPGPLRTTAGLLVQTEYALEDLVDADTVLVPAMCRRAQLDPPAPLVEAVRAAHAAGSRIVGLCTGAYVLGAAGLLDGRPVTTHWMNAFDFAQRFPRARLDPTVLYVDDGDVLTSAGTAAGIDLCLHIARTDHGAAVAGEIARRMVLPPHREGSQAQRSASPLWPRPDDGLGPVLEWARRRLDQPLTVADLAREAHLSTRTLARRFRGTLGTTPLQWLLEQRVRLAQELLESTEEPIERIAGLTGFGNPASLRQHFYRLAGVSPQSYRQVFRYRPASRPTPTETAS